MSSVRMFFHYPFSLKIKEIPKYKIIILLTLVPLFSSCRSIQVKDPSQVSDFTCPVMTPIPTFEMPSKIERHPPVGSQTVFPCFKNPLSSLPSYDPTKREIEQVDLRHCDIASLDLSGREYDLLHSIFDTETIWPARDQLPKAFDPMKIIEYGKNPGLKIRQLHQCGITGEGVGIAIIDQTLLVDHQEYADRLRRYEESNDIQGVWRKVQMHGPAVASIAVGETTGVAPGADLYYIATSMCSQGTYETVDFACLAESVRRILEINRQLPENRKIRVLSMSVGWSSQSKGYSEIMNAVKEAEQAGIFVISSSLDETNGYKFMGLGRNPLADPDDIHSYGLGIFWTDYFLQDQTWLSGRLLVPMDSRATASPTGLDEYVFYYQGGLSWSIPYLAGVYALAVQVDPMVTPEQFWSFAMETGKYIEIEIDGEKFSLGPILDPVELIKGL